MSQGDEDGIVRGLRAVWPAHRLREILLSGRSLSGLRSIDSVASFPHDAPSSDFRDPASSYPAAYSRERIGNSR